LKSGTLYQDLEADFYTRRESAAAKQAYLMRKLQELNPGCVITIIPRRPPDRPAAIRPDTCHAVEQEPPPTQPRPSPIS
jgi:hypothetical protein